MSKEGKLRDFSLQLISILVWFEILWAIVLVCGMVFEWSGLTSRLTTAFYVSGFSAGIVLIALTLLNIVSNLNIISKAQSQKLEGEEKKHSFAKTIGIAAGLIIIIVVALWFAEWRVYKSTSAESIAKLESIAETNLIAETVKLVKNDGLLKDLIEIREVLSENIQSGGRLSIIVPMKVKGVDVYYELTAWYYDKDKDKSISSVGLPKFIPNKLENSKFNELKSGSIKSFTVQHGSNLRAFFRAETTDGHIILLIDTGRELSYSK